MSCPPYGEKELGQIFGLHQSFEIRLGLHHDFWTHKDIEEGSTGFINMREVLK